MNKPKNASAVAGDANRRSVQPDGSATENMDGFVIEVHSQTEMTGRRAAWINASITTAEAIGTARCIPIPSEWINIIRPGSHLRITLDLLPNVRMSEGGRET